MRVYLLLAGICLFGVVQAQRPRGLSSSEGEERTHLLKVNILSPFISTLNIHYEKCIDESSSFQLEAFYFGGQILSQQLDVQGLGITANYRFYLTQQFPRAWFVQPFMRYQRYWPLTPPQNNRDVNVQVGGLGIVFGYQFIVAKRISFDAFAGPVYSKLFVNNQTRGRNYIPVFNGPWMRVGATIGFLF